MQNVYFLSDIWKCILTPKKERRSEQKGEDVQLDKRRKKEIFETSKFRWQKDWSWKMDHYHSLAT